MSKPRDKMTKAELLACLAVQDREIAVLRDRCSVLSAPRATSRPAWLAEVEAKREAMARAKAEAIATGRTVKVQL